MAHAVDGLMSGPVPLLPKDTSPSRQQATHLPVPTVPIFRLRDGPAIEDTVSPPRAPGAGRSSDVSITKVSVPLPMQAVVIAVALGIAAQLWGLGSRLDNLKTSFEARDKYEQRYQEQLEKTIALQIENAGLRTTAMELSTAIANLRAQKGR